MKAHSIDTQLTTSLNSIPVERRGKRGRNLLAWSPCTAGAADDLHARAREGVVVIGRVARAALYSERERSVEVLDNPVAYSTIFPTANSFLSHFNQIYQLPKQN